jgi:cell division control protein 24
MTGKSEDLIKRWSDKVMELATAERKKQEEMRTERARLQGRLSNPGSAYQPQSTWAPATPASEQPPFSFPPPMPNTWPEDDEDESGFRSGRTTPSISGSTSHSYAPSGRRVLSQQSAPTDRQTEFRARALTEDQYGPSMTQWRSQQMPPPLPRLTSAMSAMSTASDASFGNARPVISRNASSNRLGPAEEVEEESPMEQREAFHRFGPSRGMTRTPSHGASPSVPVPYPPSLRSRSASSPNVYQAQPKVSPAPPIPNTAGYAEPYSSLATSSSSTLVGGTAYFTKRMSAGKRSSGGSNSTETSETSSGQSPATPYGNPSDLRGVTPVSRQNSSDLAGQGSSIIVKVRWSEVSHR